MTSIIKRQADPVPVISHSKWRRQFRARVEEIRRRDAEERARQGSTSCKPVRCIETGKLYRSVSAAAKSTGCSVTAISLAVKNRWLAGGYTWRFERTTNVSGSVSPAECTDSGVRGHAPVDRVRVD